jgi:hypothetical protein
MEQEKKVLMLEIEFKTYKECWEEVLKWELPEGYSFDVIKNNKWILKLWCIEKSSV